MSALARTWLRRLTALLIVGALAAIATTAAYRARLLTPDVVEVTPPQGDEVGDSTNGETVNYYEGLEHKETIAGQIIFTLKSARTLGLASGWHEIKGVRLQLFNEGAPGAVLTCESASFNMQTRDARLSGTVHLQFPDGSFLNTERGHFDAASRYFVSDAEVVLAGRGNVGRAERAVYALAENRLSLEGQVLIQSDTGGSLRAARLDYLRSSDRISLPQGCRLEFGASRLEAPHAQVELEPDGGSLRDVTFTGGVEVRTTATADGSEMEGWVKRLSARRDGAGRWQIHGSTDGPWITFVVTQGVGFFERVLKTWSVRGVFVDGSLLNLRAEGGVCLSEVPDEGAPRRAEARQARVWFADGQATDMELEQEVVLHQEQLRAAGARARLSSPAGVVMLHADPTGGQRASLISGEGLVMADQVQLHDADGRAEARGNVQGEIKDVTLFGGQPEADEGPLHFAAESLDVTDDGNTYQLHGNARAWQENRLLLGDEVSYGQREQRLTAVGHVRTTFPASQLEPEAEEAHDVVVVARSLDYGRDGQRAVYKGNVRYSDANHILSAAELEVEFDDQSSVRTIEARGNVDLTDLATGRRMRGHEARREMESKVVHLTGNPVQISDDKGNVTLCSSLTWDQASGRVTISGSPDSQTETIYHPEERSEPESAGSLGPRAS